ncbi:MAG: methylmalonyl-CoA epimerase [Alphaproteobacteria bacterium]|nr:methylmalonyl-CoA epimerase [Alphaproteobacteria bacterium]
MIGNLSHIAIAVPDLDAAINQYENIFGAFVSTPSDLPSHGVRIAMVKLPNTTIELITPLGKTSPLKNFLKKNPEGGIHHLCYEVLNISKARDTLIAAGLRVIGDGVPTPGYHGNPVLFFHPKDCLGALIELEEIGLLKDHERHTHPIQPVHSSSPSESFRGTESIGISFDVDFKNKTPEDNGERE